MKVVVRRSHDGLYRLRVDEHTNNKLRTVFLVLIHSLIRPCIVHIVFSFTTYVRNKCSFTQVNMTRLTSTHTLLYLKNAGPEHYAIQTGCTLTWMEPQYYGKLLVVALVSPREFQVIVVSDNVLA